MVPSETKVSTRWCPLKLRLAPGGALKLKLRLAPGGALKLKPRLAPGGALTLKQASFNIGAP